MGEAIVRLSTAPTSTVTFIPLLAVLLPAR